MLSVTWGFLALTLATPSRSAQAPRLDGLTPLLGSALRSESGRLLLAGTGFRVRDPVFRAIAPETSGLVARIVFTYRGPSQGVAPLASGELRRQIGLKLKARNTCNVVYVMWRIAPSAGIHVQVKSNPGRRTHEECRDLGYRTVVATWRRDAPVLEAGQRRVLTAEIEANVLRVAVDDVPVWEGALPDSVLASDGPVGVRSDNGDFDVELWATRRGARGE